jgi:hypothetical protein
VPTYKYTMRWNSEHHRKARAFCNFLNTMYMNFSRFSASQFLAVEDWWLYKSI